MTLNDHMTCQVIAWVPDDFGGLTKAITETMAFWGQINFVSAKDILSAKIPGQHTIIHPKKKAVYKITVRDSFELPQHCQILFRDQVYGSISALYADPKTTGYGFFYVCEQESEVRYD